jgi:predicted NBD/HSP70 family sugar kinase
MPIGIATAGLINPATGRLLAANLAANGQPFPADIAQAAGQPVTFLNDARAMALSEAVFGMGKGQRTVMSLILGTGVGSGLSVDGAIPRGPTGTGGEVGHTSAPAHVIASHGLPLHPCGRGRTGCVEAYISGPGLTRLAQFMTGQTLTPPEIAERKGGDMAKVWAIWCSLTGDLIHTLTLTADPDVITLGGGLSHIEGLTEDLMAVTKSAQIGDFPVPPIVLAQGGDASGARGAAYAAWQEAQNV